jgi:hypothetical protein
MEARDRDVAMSLSATLSLDSLTCLHGLIDHPRIPHPRISFTPVSFVRATINPSVGFSCRAAFT